MSGVKIIKRPAVWMMSPAPRVSSDLIVPQLKLSSQQKLDLHGKNLGGQRQLHQILKHVRIRGVRSDGFYHSGTRQFNFQPEEAEAIANQLWDFLQQFPKKKRNSSLDLTRDSTLLVWLRWGYMLEFCWKPNRNSIASAQLSLILLEPATRNKLGELLLSCGTKNRNLLQLSLNSTVAEGYFGADMVERILFNLLAVEQDYRCEQLLGDLHRLYFLKENQNQQVK